MLADHHFDALYLHSADPWGFRSRWYEQRKRALALAALPQRRYGSAIEAGCANGELAAALAERCSGLLACDFHEKALDLAARRLAEHGHVRVERRRLPQEWPQQRFDLAVVSELGYYLTPSELERLAEAIAVSLVDEGRVFMRTPRGPQRVDVIYRRIDDAFLDGDRVHRILQRHTGLKRLASHVEHDFRIEVWSADGRTVAQREGLV